MSKQKTIESRLRKVLACEIVVIVLLSAWLGFTGGFADLFRKDGEGAEPTVGRMAGVCLSNGMVIMSDGDETVCGTLGAPMRADENTDGGAVKVYKARMVDEDVESGEELYTSITNNVGRGTATVLLEDSDEMLKFLDIIGDSSYNLMVYYRGKKLSVDGTDLTAMENALVRLGAPNRNRSDTGETLALVETAKNERKNIAALGTAKYYMERSLSYNNKFPGLGNTTLMAQDPDYVAPEIIMDIDENDTYTKLGGAYSVMISERGPITNYKGEKLYFAATSVPRPDLTAPGAMPDNQILFHYYAECVDGAVVASKATGKNGGPLFAMTFPKLDGKSFYCITGNTE